MLASGPLRIVGSDAEGEVRVGELRGHPFFVGTLYVPQARSMPDSPHPLASECLRAVIAHRGSARSRWTTLHVWRVVRSD